MECWTLGPESGAVWKRGRSWKRGNKKDETLLELPELVSAELSALIRYIDPQTPMTTDRRRALDGEADNDGIARLGGDVDIFASDLGRAVVVERE